MTDLTSSGDSKNGAQGDGALSDDIAFMRAALSLARRAGSHDEVPVGAVIVKNGQVVGQGFNQPVGSHDPSAHAEICALRDAGQTLENYRLPGCTLYVTIEPCTMCLGAIIHARIERLVFGAAEPRYGAVSSGQRLLENGVYNHELEVSSGILADEASALMKQFFRQRRDRRVGKEPAPEAGSGSQ
ncbi:tRNA adenosine(34) deaminase TadA [Pseudohongiella sp.]|uniref:tRNA-specific adenosine deaminase 2 n=1 Tax=marine sediment metagenome TaxID=412755 RepID=A0A0F9W3Q8_9ZZZZ